MFNLLCIMPQKFLPTTKDCYGGNSQWRILAELSLIGFLVAGRSHYATKQTGWQRTH